MCALAQQQALASTSCLLNKQTAAGIVQRTLATVRTQCKATCDEAILPDVDRNLFGGRIFPNPYIFGTHG